MPDGKDVLDHDEKLSPQITLVNECSYIFTFLAGSPMGGSNEAGARVLQSPPTKRNLSIARANNVPFRWRRDRRIRNDQRSLTTSIRTANRAVSLNSLYYVTEEATTSSPRRPIDQRIKYAWPFPRTDRSDATGWFTHEFWDNSIDLARLLF